jgi:hypothetical protein
VYVLLVLGCCDGCKMGKFSLLVALKMDRMLTVIA